MTAVSLGDLPLLSVNSSQAEAWSFFTIFRQFFPAGSLRADPSDRFALLQQGE